MRTKKPDSSITCAGAAQMFNIDPHEMTTMIRTGKIHCWKRGNLKYVDPEEIRIYRANNMSNKSLDRSSSLYPASKGIIVDASTSIERLLHIEQEAFNDYKVARESGKMDAIKSSMKAYSDISNTISDAMKRDENINAIKEEWWVECSDTINKYLEPIKSIIDQMPKSLANICNPTNPELAEKTLINWRDKSLLKTLATIPEKLK